MWHELDRMTREEAIEFIAQSVKSDVDMAKVADAIKALEQEPILDQITEIIEPLRHVPIGEMSDIEWDILRVIDKYKAEVRDNNG